jgi:predicted metal-dependent enzyme (double-stranded beta helix superfamily)
MDDKPYTPAQLVSDLRQASAESLDEGEVLIRVRAIAQRAASCKKMWLEEHMCHPDPEQGFGVYVLHEEKDHTLAVFVASWLPHRGTPPHDHGTWAVVAGIDGAEKNEFWERVDDRSRPGYADLKKIGEKVFDDGDVLVMPQGKIHSVWNETDQVTISLHIYGKHVNYTERSQYDPDKRTETPYRVTTRH